MTLTNTQLAKLWTGWALLTFGWGFWHGYNQLAMVGWMNWLIQGVSVALTIWVVSRLWRVGP
ncbi:MAG: hypothetical protein CMP14_03465 [Rickettsiales bacterium]|nr:hypothetical protein [Rickettsiales bacterium]